MKAHAATLAMLMIASSLAGCTTTGTDGVPEVTLDDEDIETFLDDYFQDFVNNSSVVINQEIHYHNETTVNEGDDSSVRHYNGSGPGAPTVHVLDMVIDSSLLPSEDEEEIPDYRSNSLVVQYEYYDFSTEEQRNDDFTIACNAYYLIESNSYWNDSSNYYSVWIYEYNETMADVLQYWSGDSLVEETCGANAFPSNMVNADFIETYDVIIEIPEGYVLSCIPDVGGGSYMLDLYHRPDFENYDESKFSTDSFAYPETEDHGHIWAQINSWTNSFTYEDYPLQYSNSHSSWPGIDSKTANDLPNNCNAYAGDGEQTDYVITVSFHTLTQVRLVFFYQLIPVDNLMA